MKTFTNLLLTCGLFASFVGGAFAQPKIKLLGTSAKLGGSTTDVWSWVDPKTGKEYCAVGAGDLHIVDVSNPASPQKVSSVTGVPVFDEKVWINPADKKVYVYTVNGGGNGNGSVIDVTNPSNPIKAGNFRSSHNITIDDEKGLMILSIPGLRIMDLKSNPTSPQQLWSENSEGHDVTVVGNMLYDFNGRRGTYIYNMADPRSPRKLGSLTGNNIKYSHHGMPSEPRGEGEKQYLYICDELSKSPSDDISIADITDPTDIRKVGGYNRRAVVHNLYVKGDYAYTSYYQDGFIILGIKDPSKMTFVAQHDNAGGSGEGMGGNFGICPYGTNNKMFHSSDGKLFVYDVSEFAVGVEDNDFEDISMDVYPNPNSGTFFLDIKGNITKDMSPVLKVTTIDGKLVINQELNTSDLSNKKISLDDQPKGVYFVQFQTNKKNINKKVVIK